MLQRLRGVFLCGSLAIEKIPPRYRFREWDKPALVGGIGQAGACCSPVHPSTGREGIRLAPCCLLFPLEYLRPFVYVFNMATASPVQFDLITDDPRLDSSAMDDFREWWKASKELHGLLVPSQAASILGVSRGQMGTWIARGRITSRVVCGIRMVSGGEVAALLKERKEKIRNSGGRGMKAPALSTLVADAWEDMGMDDI